MGLCRGGGRHRFDAACESNLSLEVAIRLNANGRPIRGQVAVARGSEQVPADWKDQNKPASDITACDSQCRTRGQNADASDGCAGLVQNNARDTAVADGSLNGNRAVGQDRGLSLCLASCAKGRHEQNRQRERGRPRGGEAVVP